MNRLGAGCQRNFDDLVRAQIAFLGCRRADQHRLVAYRDVLGGCVRFRINGNRLDSQPARGSGHSAGNLAAIGNQDFCEHVLSFIGSDFWYRKTPGVAACKLFNVALINVCR